MGHPRGQFAMRKTDLRRHLEDLEQPIVLADDELAKSFGTSTRQVQKYLKALRDEGELTVERIRYRLPLGWSNRRVIKLTDWAQVARASLQEG